MAKFCLGCGQRLPSACPACGHALPDGAKFCIECGASVASGTAPTNGSPASYTPRHLAEKILASRSAIEGERKPVTVLFCDVVNSTALAERLGPEGMHAVLSRFFDTALGEVHRYEGTINQFLGDGFMALFGAPLAHEDHARRAVLAALDIRRAVQEQAPVLSSSGPERLDLRMGIHTGFVVVGAIGDNLRMDYTAVGDTTHLAARLQQLAVPGTIVISEATARLVRGYVSLEPQGEAEVRGRSGRVSIALVTGRAAGRAALDRTDERPLSRFVGRTRELAALRGLFAEVEASRGQVVGLVGEPGVGKSRLLLELRQMLSERGLTYLEGRCLSFGRAIPYLPLLDVVRTACELAEIDSPETIHDKVQRALESLGMNGQATAPFVTHLLGVKDASDTLGAASPESIKARTFDVLRQMLVRASQRQPLILAIEDLHWADGMSQDFLASLVEALTGAPIMLLTTYRPGYRPPWIDKSYATQLSLGRLMAADSLSVVRSVLPDAGPADPIAQLILDKAEGNPFFLEELTRAVRESPHGTESLVVPDTVHGVLTARIDRLADSSKRLLQTASILGREFPVRLLEAIWDGEPPGPLLHDLSRQEFVYERSGADEPTYVFKHALTQDVAESTVLSPRRRELHFRAAEALGTLHPHRSVEIAPMRAHHYFAAEAWSLACEHASRAAEAASAAYANREALEQYDHVLIAGERAGLPAAERMRLHANRGHVHGRLGAFEAARADFEAALALARETGDARACAELLGTLGELWGGHKDYQRGLALTREAVSTAEAAGDRHALAESLMRTGLMSVNVGQGDEGERALERALGIFEDLGDEAGSAKTLDVLSMAHGIGGKPRRAIERGRAAVDRYKALGNRMALPSITAGVGFWLGHSGSWAEGEALISEALTAALTMGARSDEAFAHQAMAEISVPFGEFAGGLREAVTALEIARQIGHREWACGSLHAWGCLRRECGDPTGARAIHEEMLTITHELGNAIWTVQAFEDLGHDALALDDVAGAAAAFDQAMAKAGGSIPYAIIPVALGQAEVMLRQRRPEAALARARQAADMAAEFRPWYLEARRVEGESLLALGRAEEGERVLRAAKAEAHSTGAEPVWWRVTLALADVLDALGRPSEAGAERAAALGVLQRVASTLAEDLRQCFIASSPMRRARGEWLPDP